MMAHYWILLILKIEKAGVQLRFRRQTTAAARRRKCPGAPTNYKTTRQTPAADFFVPMINPKEQS